MTDETKQKFGLLKKLFGGWIVVTVGGAIVTYGLHAANDSTALFTVHLINWSVVSGGVLVVAMGAGMVIQAIEGISKY